MQNERAVRLYRRHGFVERHALHGYQRQADAGEARAPSAGLACTQGEALAWLREAEAAIPDLPLQVSAGVVGVLTVPWTAWGTAVRRWCSPATAKAASSSAH